MNSQMVSEGAPAPEPTTAPPVSLLQAQLAAMSRMMSTLVTRQPNQKQRSGYTKNHGQPRSKARAKMARESRRINRRK